MSGKIKALPSVIVMPDGSEKELDLLTDEQREKWNAEICRQTGNAISGQYSGCVQEWNKFAKSMMS